MFDKIKEVMELQKKAKEIQKKLADIQVEQSEGGVTLRMNGLFKVETITIDPSLLSIEKKEKLESLLGSLFSKTVQEAQKRSALQSQDFLKGFSL